MSSPDKPILHETEFYESRDWMRWFRRWRCTYISADGPVRIAVWDGPGRVRRMNRALETAAANDRRGRGRADAPTQAAADLRTWGL